MLDWGKTTVPPGMEVILKSLIYGTSPGLFLLAASFGYICNADHITFLMLIFMIHMAPIDLQCLASKQPKCKVLKSRCRGRNAAPTAGHSLSAVSVKVKVGPSVTILS